MSRIKFEQYSLSELERPLIDSGAMRHPLDTLLGHYGSVIAAYRGISVETPDDGDPSFYWAIMWGSEAVCAAQSFDALERAAATLPAHIGTRAAVALRRARVVIASDRDADLLREGVTASTARIAEARLRIGDVEMSARIFIFDSHGRLHESVPYSHPEADTSGWGLPGMGARPVPDDEFEAVFGARLSPGEGAYAYLLRAGLIQREMDDAGFMRDIVRLRTESRAMDG